MIGSPPDRSRRIAVLLCFLATAFGYRCSKADTFTWTGASPPIPFANNWSNPLNWQASQIPVSDGTSDVIIPDTPRDNQDVDQPWSIKSLTFQGGGNYSLNEDPLTVDDITHNGTGTATFNNSVGVLGTSATWQAINGPMVFNGAITGSNSVTIHAPEPITLDGSAANTLSGSVNVNQGTLVLSKSSINGAIAGNLRIETATVRWDASEQVGELAASQVNVRDGGVADLNGRDETVAQLIIVSGGRVESTGGRLTVTVQLAMQDAAEVDLGSGELVLEAAITRSGASSSTARVSAGQITLNKPQNLFSASDSSALVDLELNGNIVGDSTALFQKTGPGTLRLIGASTYQGGTTISSGVLIVDNATGSGTGTGSVTVQSGAILTGDGTISGPVNVGLGGAISPSNTTGLAIGSLTVGSLSMNTTSEFEVQFNHALPPSVQRDMLTVTNNALLNGNLILENLNLTLLPGSSTTYTVLTSSNLIGSFANAANGARLSTVDGSGSFVVNYGSGSPFNVNHVVLSDFLAEGEPGDFDFDGDVDGRDLLIWQRGDSPTPLGTSDLAAWQANFGASGEVSAVPEPHAAAVLLLGQSWLFGSRRVFKFCQAA